VIEKQMGGPKYNDQNLSKTKPGDAAGPEPTKAAVTDGANLHQNNAKIINIADYKKTKQLEQNAFSDIVHNVSSQLTGSQENDLKFLKNEVYKYSQHKYATEIIRAIGRMMYDVLPLDKKNELFKIFSSLSISSDIILNESKLKIQEGNLEEAEKLIISILPDENFFEDDQNSTYFCFNNPFEEIYYSIKFNPQKEIHFIPNFDTDRFLVYAYILIERGKYDQALKVLNQGLRFNPIDTKLLFEKGEIYKIKKDWENFKLLTDRCLACAYTPDEIARAYRNYGYMFIEQGDYDAAICCYLASLNFEANELAQSQMFYISQATNKTIDPDRYYCKLEKVFKQRNIQLGPSEDILGIAFSLAERFENDGNLEGAFYCYRIYYELTQDQEIVPRLEKLQNSI
jgi:tetratricopeptide (TPR) repeat protein